MDKLIIIYEHIWNFALVIAVFGAVFYFVKVLRESYRGLDHGVAYIGKFYDNGDAAYKLKPACSEWKSILILIGIFFAVQISHLAIGFILKSVYDPGYTFSFSTILAHCAKWDANHYIGLAQNGYQNTGDPRFHIVFYPLYPLLVRGLSYICGGNITVAAYVESNLFMAMSIAVMYKLLKIDFSERVTWTAILLLILNPFGFFFSFPFTESTFLFLSLLFFFMLRRENWLAAGICGFFAALTRNFGLLMLVPYGVWLITVACKRRYDFKKIVLRLLPAFLVLAGFGVYLLINKIVTGNWFQFMIYQKEHWYQEISCILENVTNHFKWFVNENTNMTHKWFLWFGNVSAACLTMFAIYIKHRKIPFVYNIYTLAYLFLTLMASWLLSGSRYIMAAFPVYIAYALLIDKSKLVRYVGFVIEYLLGAAVLFAYLMNASIM